MVKRMKYSMSESYGRFLLYLFCIQNGEKSFDEFGTLYGSDENYIGVKIKDLKLVEHHGYIYIEEKSGNSMLCDFELKVCKFGSFGMEPNSNKHSFHDFDILDHISFEDLV